MASEDQQWARRIERRLAALENPRSIRLASGWTIDTADNGDLIARSPRGVVTRVAG